MVQASSENPSSPVTIACAGCGKLYEFPNRSAVEQVWCSGCGELIGAQEGASRKVVVPLANPAPLKVPPAVPREVPVRKSRPLSVQIGLLAGGLAVFMEMLAALNSWRAVGPMPLSAQILWHPWWIFLIVWVGLLGKSQRAAQCAMGGGVIVAFLLCNHTLGQQIALWGTNPPWRDLFWGTLRVMLRSVPLLVMVAALGTSSARDYYRAPFSE